MTSQRKVTSQETLGCGQHSTLKISAGRTVSWGVGLNNSSPPPSRYHRRSVPSTLPARPVQADLWQSQRGLCSGSCNYGNLQPALLCPEGGLPVCGCHAGRVFWVHMVGLPLSLNTGESLAVAFLEGGVQRAPEHVHWGSVMSAQSGCFTDIIVHSYNIPGGRCSYCHLTDRATEVRKGNMSNVTQPRSGRSRTQHTPTPQVCSQSWHSTTKAEALTGSVHLTGGNQKKISYPQA